MKSAYFIMKLCQCQTGHVDSHNISESHVNPEEGFETYEEAEEYMINCSEKRLYEYSHPWDTFCIMKLYKK